MKIPKSFIVDQAKKIKNGKMLENFTILIEETNKKSKISADDVVDILETLSRTAPDKEFIEELRNSLKTSKKFSISNLFPKISKLYQKNHRTNQRKENQQENRKNLQKIQDIFSDLNQKLTVKTVADEI